MPGWCACEGRRCLLAPAAGAVCSPVEPAPEPALACEAARLRSAVPVQAAMGAVSTGMAAKSSPDTKDAAEASDHVGEPPSVTGGPSSCGSNPSVPGRGATTASSSRWLRLSQDGSKLLREEGCVATGARPSGASAVPCTQAAPTLIIGPGPFPLTLEEACRCTGTGLEACASCQKHVRVTICTVRIALAENNLHLRPHDDAGLSQLRPAIPAICRPVLPARGDGMSTKIGPVNQLAFDHRVKLDNL